jgi:hypothetical protein
MCKQGKKPLLLHFLLRYAVLYSTRCCNMYSESDTSPVLPCLFIYLCIGIQQKLFEEVGLEIVD